MQSTRIWRAPLRIPIPIPLLFLIPLLLYSGVATLNAAPSKKPNVLFIAIDDLNDWVGALQGHPQVKTPNIDRLARKGALFTNAHCQAPLCNPSRTSVLTGLRPSTTGVHGLAPWFRTLAPLKDHVSLPQHFSNNGYKTLTTGKIFHDNNGRRPTDSEFQIIGPAAGVGARPTEKLIPPTPGGNHPLMDWGTFPHTDPDKQDYTVATWAVEQLGGTFDSPFFLSVGFFLPHVPCYATQAWFDLYPEEGLQMPPVNRDDRKDTPAFSWNLHWDLPEPRLSWCESNQQWMPLVRSYLACISFVDSQVGRLLDALEKSEYRDNTLIVLWSDHGYHLGEKLITGKNTLWERSTRVPLIFAGPGIPAGIVCDEPVELLDIYPTLAELCGLPSVPHLEGHSIVPLWTNPSSTREWPAITTHNQGNHAVRSKHWRYIRYADGSEELYNMRSDPNEWTNLAGLALHQDVLEEHRRWLPRIDRPSAPGSRHRILSYDPDTRIAVWEGTPIDPSKRIE